MRLGAASHNERINAVSAEPQAVCLSCEPNVSLTIRNSILNTVYFVHRGPGSTDSDDVEWLITMVSRENQHVPFNFSAISAMSHASAAALETEAQAAIGPILLSLLRGPGWVTVVSASAVIPTRIHCTGSVIGFVSFGHLPVRSCVSNVMRRNKRYRASSKRLSFISSNRTT